MALREDETDSMNLREWDRRARLIREHPSSRRFSASYIGSFREDHHPKSSSKIANSSSTASSPGYTLKEEIDPSTYSFTNALKALQGKTMCNNRDWLTKEGFVLNSKWSEAEKYICNPLSGEVPMECLSSKTLSARSFRTFTTMSAPLQYCPVSIGQSKRTSNVNVRVIHEEFYDSDAVLVRAEKKVVGLKRDVGIQSTSVDLSSGSLSPAKTPEIMERSLKRHVEANESPVESNPELEGQHEDVKLEEKVKEEEKQEMSKVDQEGEDKQEMNEEQEEEKEETKSGRGRGCFSWVRTRQRRARKSKYIFPVCVPHLVKGC